MKKSRRIVSKLVVPILTVLALSHPVLAAPIELSLDESIALALNSHPAMKIAEADKEKSYWAIKEARAGKKIAVTYTHTDQRYKNISSASSSKVTNYFDNEIKASMPIYSGGKLESQVDQANLNLKVADLNIAATKQQLKLDVTTYYFTVLQYRNELQVSQETVNDLEAHLKNVQAQYDAGMVAKSDVLASEVELANAQNSLIKAQNNYDLAMANLNNAIGLPLDSELKLQEDLKYEKNLLDLAACSRDALANRPEMAEYQANIAIARDDVKIAKSGYRPTVTFSVAQDWNDTDFPGADNSNWLVALTTSVNVFDSGTTKSQVKQAHQGLVKVQEQARQNRDSILLEVRESYLSMREAEKRIETSEVAVDKAAEDARIAEVRYAAGVGTNLDVLDAVLALNEAKMNYFEALYDYNVGKANLDKAMGVAVN